MPAGPVRYVLSKLLGSATFKGRLWTSWYRYFERAVGEQPIWLLNYGYQPDNYPLKLLPPDAHNRTSIQLYDVVTRAVDLAGKTVLEVSCGRGGGARFLHAYRKPNFMVGLDRTEAAIAFCRRHHGGRGLEFVCGDAQQLPFPAGSFDAVVNVEASHCYPDVPRFFREVQRVLRPGGHFLYADMRKTPMVEAWRQELRGAGFPDFEEKDITPNVIRALEKSSDRVSDLINRSAPRLTRSFFSHFAATKGTSVFNQLQSGAVRYTRFVLQKS